MMQATLTDYIVPHKYIHRCDNMKYTQRMQASAMTLRVRMALDV